MKVYCVMEKNYYRYSVEKLCSIWFSKEKAEKVVESLNEEYEPYEYYVREEEVHDC